MLSVKNLTVRYDSLEAVTDVSMDVAEGTVVSLLGSNGSGKSTFTKTILRHNTQLTVIDPDFIAKTMTGSFATVDAAQVGAGRQALKMVQRCIQEREDLRNGQGRGDTAEAGPQ